MITKLTEQKGCIIAEFIDLKRFTLAVTEEVKSELKPILSQEGNKMIFDFKNIEFIDSSGIGCIILKSNCAIYRQKSWTFWNYYTYP